MMNDPLMMLVDGVRRGGNPVEILEQMARQDPNLLQDVNRVMNVIGGKNPQQLRVTASNMMRERGVTVDSVMTNIMRQFGRK